MQSIRQESTSSQSDLGDILKTDNESMLEIRRGNNSASDIKTITDGDLDEEDE